MTILFLEPDEYEESIALKQYLKNSNHSVSSIESFHKALTLIEQDEIDIIFVNFNFHFFNPHLFIQNIKSEKSSKDTAVIALLKKDEHYHFQKALISGADFCLTRPYETHFLEIENLIKSKSQNHILDDEKRKYITFSQKLILELEEKISHLENNNIILQQKNLELKRLSSNLDEINDLTSQYIHKLNEIELSFSSQNLLEKLELFILEIFHVEAVDLFLYKEKEALFQSKNSNVIAYDYLLSELIIAGKNPEIKKELNLKSGSNPHIFIMNNKSVHYKDTNITEYHCNLNHKEAFCHHCLGRFIHGFIIINDNKNNLNSSKEKLLQSFINQSILIYEHKLLVEHLNKLYQTAEKKAITDPLTNIFNKRFFTKSLEQKFYYSKRSMVPLSLIMIDIDFFKRYNDNFGHPAGDSLLKEFAFLINKSIRKSDIFARYGGEEFVIITPGLNIADAKKLAEKLRKLIEQHTFKIKGSKGTDKITASFGVGTVNSNIKHYEELIDLADKNLYSAKESGRNLVR